MLASGRRAGWSAATDDGGGWTLDHSGGGWNAPKVVNRDKLWRDVAVDGSGGRTLVHSGGGRSAPKVVEARWLAVAWRDAAVMINNDGRRPIGLSRVNFACVKKGRSRPIPFIVH